MPGLSPIIGATEEEAQQKYKELQELIPPASAVMMLSGMLSFDLSEYPMEGQLPEISNPVYASNGMKNRVQLIMDMARG